MEFALVLPILLILLLGLIDFGMAFHGVVTVNTAAREGARQGVVLNNDDGATDSGTVVTAARRVTGTLPNEINRLTIEIGGTTAFANGTTNVFSLPPSGSEMEVIVTYDYDLITPLPAFVGIDSPLTLRGVITMMRE